MKNKVSIIIPFVMLNPYVHECILNCLRLDYPDYEIILLPDNRITLPGELRDGRVRIIETGPENIASKRNIGINNSTGDFYAFIDSDAYPARHWLTHAIKAFSEDADIWAVGGPNITPPDEDLYRKSVGNSLKSFLVSGGNSFRKKIAESRYCLDLPSCNLILCKEAIKTLKGFKEALFTGEDIDLCIRLINENKRIFYNGKAIVYHHNRALFKPYFLQRITYGLTVFRSLKEHISLRTVTPLAPMFFILFLIAGGIISFFSRGFFLFYSAITLSYLAVIILETIRYSEYIKEVPLTFLSLIIGNISPGIGSLMTLFGFKIDISRIYRNYDKS